MALTEKTEWVSLDADATGVVRATRALIVERDGSVVSRTLHKDTFYPGDDVSGAPSQVQAVAAALWTAEVVAAFKQLLTAERSNAPSPA